MASIDSPVSGEQPTEGLPDEPQQVILLGAVDLVLFPGSFLPLHLQEPELIRIIDAAFQGDRRVAVVARRAQDVPEGETPEAHVGELREVGCLAQIPRMRRLSDGSMQLLLQGQERVRVLEAHEESSPPTATVEAAPEQVEEDDTLIALMRTVRQSFGRMSDLIPQANPELQQAVEAVEEPLQLVYLLAGTVRMSADERYRLLELDHAEEKLQRLLRVLNRELELLELGSRIQSEAQEEMEKGRREYFLRQQLQAIRRELGESDENEAAIVELRERLDAAELPEEADKAARRELRRLENVPPAAAEHHIIRTYLELILDLPWHAVTDDNLDLAHARKVLDEDHYGLEEVKDRLLEYLAVRKLKREIRGPILCLVGPPGVGKTSLGQSVARALGRKFVRISLGGVHDESEIRGHRRTYIGAMPGRIIENLRRVGTCNPVFMLDELDKVSASLHGDPSSALLEVLDPAQNNSFRDNYLDLPFDLSQVLFIATANMTGTIHPALLDRLEMITIAGYTEQEKLQIAKRHLIPRQSEDHGLSDEQMKITNPALKKIISGYTRESGVRNLDRTLAAVSRKAARRIAEGKSEKVKVGVKEVEDMLGPEKVRHEVAQRVARPGVVTGLSVTPVGGEVLFVEAVRMPGKGNLRLTGQLGDVMKESAQAAFSYLRAHADEFELASELFEKSDVHVHVPAGAIPKDGPSAGVTMATALLSSLRDQPVDVEVAMTGEISLTGQVLPVGGIKEKVLAARRAGVSTVVLPKRNEPDLRELPDDVRESLNIVTAESLDDVFAVALNAETQETNPS